jgi:phosphatidylglycerol:prolipoprotein diacylglycerol transferase
LTWRAGADTYPKRKAPAFRGGRKHSIKKSMIAYPNIDPVALRIGPLHLRWYGLMYIFGFAAAWFLGRSRTKKPWALIDARGFEDLLTYCIVGLILGARIGYVVFYEPGYFIDHPMDALAIWKGGMSFHGGLMGMLVCMWLYARKHALSFFDVTDFICPLAPPGLFAGRMGNFINGELWGRVTDVPWAMVFPRPGAGTYPRHPSQLYEAALEGVALFCILWFYTAKPRPRMAASGLFLLCYGSFRFFVEFFRRPDPQLGFIAFGWLTMGQLLCAPMILAGIALLYLVRRNRRA